MAVNKHLGDELQWLRNLISNVNGLSVQSLARAGRARVETIRASADRPERIEDALSAAEHAVSEFARAFADNWMVSHAGDEQRKRTIAEARDRVITRVDALERSLDGVELNGEKKWLIEGDSTGLNQGRPR